MREPVAVDETPPSLWHNHEFLRLWFARAVSSAGSRITGVALPLTAVLALGATPAQMGLLGIAGTLPNLVFGLVAGVWVDRARRRPVLVSADLGRAILLGSIPAAAFIGHLTLIHLLIVAFAAGTLSVFFQIASVAVLPAVVRKEHLVEANSRLATSDAIIAIAGPSAAGGIIQIVGAPRAILADTASYVASALALRGVGTTERRPSRARRSLWREIGEGLHELVRTPLLRALAVAGCVGALGTAAQGTVFMLFLVHSLSLTPATIGLVLACGGGGALLGSLWARRTARLLGTGLAVILGQGLWTTGGLLMALAGLAGPLLPLLVAGQVTSSAGATVYTITQTSLRQGLTPTELLGRVTAARRFLIFSLAPAGAALGGYLGSAIGLRPTLVVGSIISTLALLVLLLSPVRQVRD
jgi:MFS family permease